MFNLTLFVLGVPFVQDGTRDGEHHRQWMFDRFHSELRKEGLSFTLLGGGYEDRERRAIEVIEEEMMMYVEEV
jgi:nicotinamide riboside kinase